MGGTPKAGVKTGTALCLRAVTPDYTLETAQVNRSRGLSGITMYGDDKNLLVWGLDGDRLQLQLIRYGKATRLAEPVSVPAGLPVYLRMEVREGAPASFGYSTDGREWKSAGNLSAASADLLQWDRVARPGLYYQGPADYFAEFEYVHIANH